MDDAKPDAAPAPVDIHRPRAGFRVGLLGARQLDAAIVDKLSEKARTILGHIAKSVAAAAQDKLARAVYSDAPPMLHALSTLDGAADAILSLAARQAGYDLHAVLPWRRKTWQQLSAQGHADLEQALIDASDRVIEMDGGTDSIPGLPQPAEDMARAAAARMVVRNSDLLVAIWNGESGKAAGDVAATIHAALASGIPVLWIGADSLAEAKLLRQRDDLPKALTNAAPAADTLSKILDSYITEVVRPPSLLSRPPRTLGGRLESLIIGDVRHDDDRIGFYLHGERPGARPFGTWFGRRFFALRNFLAGKIEITSIEPIDARSGKERPQFASAARFSALFVRPDGLAGYYAGRYRSTFLFVFLLGAAAITTVLASAVFHHHPHYVVLEALLLVAVVLLVRWERHDGCHRRWLDYRLLAETLRLQEFLAPLGRAVPLRRLLDNVPDDQRGREWVGWYFNACLRECHLEHGSFSEARLEHFRNHAHDLLLASDQGQIAYFDLNAKRYGRAGLRFNQIALAGFAIALGVVIAKLALPVIDSLFPFETGITIQWLTLFAGLLPAFAAAFFAIRSHGEFEMLAQNGERSVAKLEKAAEQLKRLDLTLPLASEALGDEIAAATTIIISDVEGWSLLFNVKVVELGG